MLKIDYTSMILQRKCITKKKVDLFSLQNIIANHLYYFVQIDEKNMIREFNVVVVLKWSKWTFSENLFFFFKLKWFNFWKSQSTQRMLWEALSSDLVAYLSCIIIPFKESTDKSSTTYLNTTDICYIGMRKCISPDNRCINV